MNNTKVKTIHKKQQIKSLNSLPVILYGLDGIMELFHVSRNTAMRYRRTILAGACTKQGRKIIVDTKEALRLYGIAKSDNFFKQ